jgi:hypothetical protein
VLSIREGAHLTSGHQTVSVVLGWPRDKKDTVSSQLTYVSTYLSAKICLILQLLALDSLL